MSSITAPRPKPKAYRNSSGLTTLVVIDDQITLRQTRDWRRQTASEWVAIALASRISSLAAGARSVAGTRPRDWPDDASRPHGRASARAGRAAARRSRAP